MIDGISLYLILKPKNLIFIEMLILVQRRERLSHLVLLLQFLQVCWSAHHSNPSLTACHCATRSPPGSRPATPGLTASWSDRQTVGQSGSQAVSHFHVKGRTCQTSILPSPAGNFQKKQICPANLNSLTAPAKTSPHKLPLALLIVYLYIAWAKNNP